MVKVPFRRLFKTKLLVVIVIFKMAFKIKLLMVTVPFRRLFKIKLLVMIVIFKI